MARRRCRSGACWRPTHRSPRSRLPPVPCSCRQPCLGRQASRGGVPRPEGGANAGWLWLLGGGSALVVEGLVEGDQVLLEAEDGGLGAVGELQLGQDAGDVGLDGLLADLQGPGDLAV